MNLDTLRKKRVKRLGVKALTHTGQRRIFFILERATRKFYGDIGLWLQYIEYARKQRAHKKLSQIFTNVLRLHPTEAELWIYAAQYSLQDHGDITQARSYMQRGLRFCKSSTALWLQYAKLEMIYIARIAARQRILGLDERREPKTIDHSTEDHDMDMAPLPQLTGEDINPTLERDEPDQAALETLNSTPALSGAIPIAIFDAAMNQFGKDDNIGYDFYNMFAEFEETPCLESVLSHVVEFMTTHHPTSALAQTCFIKYPVVGIKPTSAQFPRAFSTSLIRLKEAMAKEPPFDVQQLAVKMVEWLQTLLSNDGLDPALRQAIEATVRSTERKIISAS